MAETTIDALKTFKDFHTKKYESLLKIVEGTRLIVLRLNALGLKSEEEITSGYGTYTRNVLTCRPSNCVLRWQIANPSGISDEALIVEIRKTSVAWKYGKVSKISWRSTPEKTVKRGDFEIPLEIVDYIKLNKDKLTIR